MGECHSPVLFMVKVPCVWLGDTRNTIVCGKGQGNAKGGRWSEDQNIGQIRRNR